MNNILFYPVNYLTTEIRQRPILMSIVYTSGDPNYIV